MRCGCRQIPWLKISAAGAPVGGGWKRGKDCGGVELQADTVRMTADATTILRVMLCLRR